MILSEEAIKTIENCLGSGERIELHVEYPFVPGTTRRDTTKPQLTIVSVKKTLVSKKAM